MSKTTIWTVIMSLALTTAAFAVTDEEKCQNSKLKALGKRLDCAQKERGKQVQGKSFDFDKCEERFTKATTKADEQAAKKNTSCRWLENGDGTATDLNSGLQWELKTDDGSIHDKDDNYTWSAVFLGEEPDGTAFVDFLGTLNGGDSSDGVTTTGCFADKCDWRLPTIEELAGIADPSASGCGGSPCTTIPGETAPGLYLSPSLYWSASTITSDAAYALRVDFFRGLVNGGGAKGGGSYVRAVRGGS